MQAPRATALHAGDSIAQKRSHCYAAVGLNVGKPKQWPSQTHGSSKTVLMSVNQTHSTKGNFTLEKTPDARVFLGAMGWCPPLIPTSEH